MPKQRVLVVDDELDIVELISYNLTREGFEVQGAHSGEDGLKQARELTPDLVVLDIMLPGMSGLDVCRNLKQEKDTRDIPIIMLSAKGDEADIVAGLELGADDYMTKPFSPRVLLARTRAVLRRKDEEKASTKAPSELLNVNDLVIDTRRHEVSLSGQVLELTATEFRILHFLASKRGWVFTRNQIIRAVHGDDYPVTDRSVDVQITGLRKKLGSFGDYLETVRGVGYRFKE